MTLISFLIIGIKIKLLVAWELIKRMILSINTFFIKNSTIRKLI